MIKDLDKALLGKRIQHARIERGISQAELVKQSGVKQPRLSMLEHGQSYPNVNLLYKLACALDVSVDYLLGLSEEMQQSRGVKSRLFLQKRTMFSEVVPTALALAGDRD